MIRKQATVFLVVGLTTVGIDFVVYHLLLLSGLPPAPAKAIGFIAGTIFSYFANRRWTFGYPADAPNRVLRFSALYLSTLALNVAVNSLVLWLGPEGERGVLAAFVTATGLSALLNFIGMKLLVFR